MRKLTVKVEHFVHLQTGIKDTVPSDSMNLSQLRCPAEAGPEPPIVPTVGAAPPPRATLALFHLISPPPPARVTLPLDTAPMFIAPAAAASIVKFSLVPEVMTLIATPPPTAKPVILMPVATDAVEASTLNTGLVLPSLPTTRALILVEPIVVVPGEEVAAEIFPAKVTSGPVIVAAMVPAPFRTREPEPESRIGDLMLTVVVSVPVRVVELAIPPVRVVAPVTPSVPVTETFPLTVSPVRVSGFVPL